jgi:hypothetical protein
MYYIKEIISISRVLLHGFNACLYITPVNRKRFRHHLKYKWQDFKNPRKKYENYLLLINDDDDVVIVDLYYSMAMTRNISTFSCMLNRKQSQGSKCNGMNFAHQSLNCWKFNSCRNTLSPSDSLSDIQKTWLLLQARTLQGRAA